jgi:AmmeMemoRadiSam system protein B/AmmeMemoRadiSam system protein A
MNRKGLYFLLGLVLLGMIPVQAAASSIWPPEEPATIDQFGILGPSVAGKFYPGDAKVLRANIAGYLEKAVLPEIDGEIVAAIVPHAGHVYSGPIAAYAYRAIAKQERKRIAAGAEQLEAVVVLAFSHRGGYADVSVYHSGALATPLGNADVNEVVAREFMSADSRLSSNKQVFIGEHSAEVQIPFLQTALPDIPIVPVMFGCQGPAYVEAVVKGLEEVAENHRIVVVATTDLSHYEPYEKANAIDGATVNEILKGDSKEMGRYAGVRRGAMCGPGPTLAAISYAENLGAEPVLLKYSNSGDTAGGKDAVVGYTSIIFVRRDKSQRNENSKLPDHEIESVKQEDDYLTEENKQELLVLARKSVESIVRDKKITWPEEPSSERLKENGAAFVTIHKNGRLRGCIGRMEAIEPLYRTVARMAASAAVQDPRFPPVRPEELDDIHIEISVNTPLRSVSGPDEIVLGKHGVVVSNGSRQGVFLPQVASETGWTKEEFLSNLCSHKAGLAPDAYKNGARLFVFTSIVFEEE